MSVITGVMQDYLKAIYKLKQDRGAVSTSEIAGRLGVAAASATNMIKRLARLRLVSYTRYYGLTLTPAGQRIALEIIRHHRLIELYLAQHLGVSLDKVDAEAERLEHVLSEDVEARMATTLGNPTQDPHGDPIPSADGTLREIRYPQLENLPTGETGVVVRVSDRNPAVLRRLAHLGVLPGVALKVVARRHGDCQVEVRGRQLNLPRVLCEGVYIQWLGAAAKS
ncbi:MAG TPA: metal-dependent transcriptional regulator [bacterium]|nr:metal-dependent transcriptional regulator [bacterium]